MQLRILALAELRPEMFVTAVAGGSNAAGIRVVPRLLVPRAAEATVRRMAILGATGRNRMRGPLRAVVSNPVADSDVHMSRPTGLALATVTKSKLSLPVAIGCRTAIPGNMPTRFRSTGIQYPELHSLPCYAQKLALRQIPVHVGPATTTVGNGGGV